MSHAEMSPVMSRVTPHICNKFICLCVCVCGMRVCVCVCVCVCVYVFEKYLRNGLVSLGIKTKKLKQVCMFSLTVVFALANSVCRRRNTTLTQKHTDTRIRTHTHMRTRAHAYMLTQMETQTQT